MGKVLTHMTMSLDGFIADPNDDVGELFEWYGAGDVSVPSASDDVSFDVDAASAEVLSDLTGNSGALVAGRRLFDITNGWNDHHPIGAAVVVVTHDPPADAAERWPKTTFVDGVAPAIAVAKEIAGDNDVTHLECQRHSASTRPWASSTKCASAWCRCCSAKASPTSPRCSTDTCCSTTPSSSQDAAPVHLRYPVRR